MKVFDIKAISEVAKNNHALLAVDNTFLTPYFQRPLDLGADMSTYSLTKYMNGHSDVIMGAIVTNNTELHDKLRFLQNGECFSINVVLNIESWRKPTEIDRFFLSRLYRYYQRKVC